MGQSVYDGNTSFFGGQNSGLKPELLNASQYWTGINTTVKNGALRPRPGYSELQNGRANIKILTEGGIVGSDGRTKLYKDILRTGKFQGAAPYIADEGKFIIAIISGIIFRINPYNSTAIVLPVKKQPNNFVSDEPPTQRLNQYVDRHYWSDAGRFFVIFDYPDYPVIIEGGEARRADPSLYEIPVPAVLGTFNQSRLWVGSIANAFLAGDPVGNPATPDAPITFEEVFAPAAVYNGQVFTLGSTNINNPITAMGELEAVDSSTGIGPMFVATNNSVYMCQTQLERAAWENSTFNIKVLSKAGIAGQRSFKNVGSDVFFMGGDGRIRSFSVARGDQSKWTRTPLDKEVLNWIRFCDKSLIQYTVVEFFNNRILFSVNPQLTTAMDLENNPVLDVSHQGLIALELDPVSGFLSVGQPCWAGLWTGINPMEFINLDNELFVFSKDSESVNVLYKVEPDEISWDTWQGKRKQIVSKVETKSYSFNEQGLMYSLKEEVTIYPGLENIEGEFCMEVARRNDNTANYTYWNKFKHIAVVEACSIEDGTIPNLVPHSFREVNFGDPLISDVCNPVSNEQIRYFNETQFRIVLTGMNWELNAFRVKAELQEDDQLKSINIQCENELKEIKVEKECTFPSDFDLYSTAFKEGEWTCQLTGC